MDTLKDIIDHLNTLKPYLHKEFNIKSIGVFGSFTDNTHTRKSDIDILVSFEKPIGWKYLSLEIYLEKELARKIDLVSYNSLREHIKADILKQVKFV